MELEGRGKDEGIEGYSLIFEIVFQRNLIFLGPGRYSDRVGVETRGMRQQVGNGHGPGKVFLELERLQVLVDVGLKIDLSFFVKLHLIIFVDGSVVFV